MSSPAPRKNEAAPPADSEDPVEAAFREAPLDEMPETDAERARMAAARSQPHAWVSNEEHQASLAERVRRER